MEVVIATNCCECGKPIFHLLPEKEADPPEAKLWQVSIWMIQAKEGAKCDQCDPVSKWEAGCSIQLRDCTVLERGVSR